MKKRMILTYLLTALAGTGLHFAYDLWPVPLVGLFAPVSESVWEHLKLLYWPFLAAAAVLTRGRRDRLHVWSAYLLSLLLQPPALTGLYYLLFCGFGVSSLLVDIGLYYLVLGAGFCLAERLRRMRLPENLLGLLIVLASIYGVSLIVFTLAAPNLPIFTAP